MPNQWLPLLFTVLCVFKGQGKKDFRAFLLVSNWEDHFVVLGMRSVHLRTGQSHHVSGR